MTSILNRWKAWLRSLAEFLKNRAAAIFLRPVGPSSPSDESPSPETLPPERLLREFALHGRIEDGTHALPDAGLPPSAAGWDPRSVVRLAWLEGTSGRVESAMLLYGQLMHGSDEPDPELRREAIHDIFHLSMRECARIRGQVAERFAAADHQGALDACSRQIELTAALLRLLDRDSDEWYWTAAVVNYNHAVASEAFGLWCCGRPAIAEEVIESAPSRHTLPPGTFPANSEADRREMVAEMVAEHGWELFARGKWRESSCAFQFARIQGYERIDGPCNRHAVELLAREAICAFNDRNFARAYELFTGVICRFPGEDVRGIRILREKAHQAKVLGDSARLYEKAAHAFKAEDWVGSAVRYRDTADFIEYREHPELRDLAAECYYNAAMAMCNCRRFRDARRILRYVQRAYPHHEPSRVAERLRQVDRFIRSGQGAPGDGTAALDLLPSGDAAGGGDAGEDRRGSSDAIQRVSTIEALAEAASRFNKRR